jgi:hypothetical protein
MNVSFPMIPVLLLICAVGMSASDRHSMALPQAQFSAEDAAVKNPVRTPQEVLDILAADERVRDTLEAEKLGTGELPRSWFSTSFIELTSGANPRHLLVMAVGPLRGANVTHFWIFQATIRGYRLVLKAPAHDLILKSTTSHGLRDIELSSMSARKVSRVLCRFNGKVYAPIGSESDSTNPEK